MAVNPRCVKEIKLALEMGCKVSVLKFTFSNWSAEVEKKLTASFPSVTFYNLSAERKPFIPWFVSTFLEKFSTLISIFVPLPAKWTGYAVGKRSWLIAHFLRKLVITPDLIIGHNPATFWPVANFAKVRSVPFAIDVEDYHPGEYKKKRQCNNTLILMKSILPRGVYVSFASPLILEVVNKQIQGLNKSVLINNCFENHEFSPPVTKKYKKLRVVWFSQHIDFGRGLEKILPVLAKVEQHIELTLIGNLRAKFQAFLVFYPFVTIVSPLPQKELHATLKNFDIGLAIEERNVDLNREICLTNKIWSYFQAGLFILASYTKAQQQFISEHGEHGVLIDLGNEESILKSINQILNNREIIHSKMLERFNHSTAYSWEKEKQKLEEVWLSVIPATNKYADH